MSEPTITTNTSTDKKSDQAPSTVHESAVRMQEQFALTGSYDASDLTRVLGDPRESVSFEVPESYSLEAKRTSNVCLTSHFSSEVKS